MGDFEKKVTVHLSRLIGRLPGLGEGRMLALVMAEG